MLISQTVAVYGIYQIVVCPHFSPLVVEKQEAYAAKLVDVLESQHGDIQGRGTYIV